VLSAVPDVNVLISGTISSRGAPFQILEAWRRREWRLIISPGILDDTQRVLGLPRVAKTYGLARQDIEDLIRLLRLGATVEPGRLTIPRTARDPDDDHILACAREGGADYVVTGDHDLLALERFQGIPILTPTRFAALLAASR